MTNPLQLVPNSWYYPGYVYNRPLVSNYTNDEVIRQLLKRIADLEARLDAKK